MGRCGTKEHLHSYSISGCCSRTSSRYAESHFWRKLSAIRHTHDHCSLALLRGAVDEEWIFDQTHSHYASKTELCINIDKSLTSGPFSDEEKTTRISTKLPNSLSSRSSTHSGVRIVSTLFLQGPIHRQLLPVWMVALFFFHELGRQPLWVQSLYVYRSGIGGWHERQPAMWIVRELCDGVAEDITNVF